MEGYNLIGLLEKDSELLRLYNILDYFCYFCILQLITNEDAFRVFVLDLYLAIGVITISHFYDFVC